MRRLTMMSILSIISLAAISVAAEPHPFSVMDMLAMDRISDPQVSPDGKLVAFSVSVTDLEANRRRSDIYVSTLDGSSVRRMTSNPASDTQPRWSPDGKSLFLVSSRVDSPQVWRLSLEGGEAEQVTKLPLGIDALKVSPDGKALLFSMAVFPGKSPAETRQMLDAKEKSKATGMLFDRLFIRHWDTWEDGTRNHLFVYPLPSGPARDLMPAMNADCPGKPFGGPEEFAVSPDGKTIVFTAQSGGFVLCTVPVGEDAGMSLPKPGSAEAIRGEDPSWAPNSRTVIFTRRVGDRRVLSLLDVTSKQVKDVRQISGSCSQPAWAR